MDKNLIFNGLPDKVFFRQLVKSMKKNITTWDCLIGYKRALDKIKPYEKELHLLNFLIGKDDIRGELVTLVREYPTVIKTFPLLSAIKNSTSDILVDKVNFIYQHIDFENQDLSFAEIDSVADWFMQCGLGHIVADRQFMSFPDYAIGVQIGMDSYSRSKRVEVSMEHIVSIFIEDACKLNGARYLSSATKSSVKREWDIDITPDISRRLFDFIVMKDDRLFILETDFYSHVGAQLKSTIDEYIKMSNFWEQQGITFIWITDGAGWQSAKAPLREFFDRSPALLNLQCLQDGALERILK